MSAELDAVKRGYAYVEMNERGRYFSEGDYDILGRRSPTPTMHLDWMGAQPWSNGKVGPHRLLLHSRVAVGRGPRGNKALGYIHPARASARASAASAHTTSRATGSAAAPCRCFSSPGSTTTDFRTSVRPTYVPTGHVAGKT